MSPDQAGPRRHGWLTANLVAQLAFGLLAMTICLPSMQEWPAIFDASQRGASDTSCRTYSSPSSPPSSARFMLALLFNSVMAL